MKFYIVFVSILFSYSMCALFDILTKDELQKKAKSLEKRLDLYIEILKERPILNAVAIAGLKAEKDLLLTLTFELAALEEKVPENALKPLEFRLKLIESVFENEIKLIDKLHPIPTGSPTPTEEPTTIISTKAEETTTTTPSTVTPTEQPTKIISTILSSTTTVKSTNPPSTASPTEKPSTFTASTERPTTEENKTSETSKPTQTEEPTTTAIPTTRSHTKITETDSPSTRIITTDKSSTKLPLTSVKTSEGTTAFP